MKENRCMSGSAGRIDCEASQVSDAHYSWTHFVEPRDGKHFLQPQASTLHSEHRAGTLLSSELHLDTHPVGHV